MTLYKQKLTKRKSASFSANNHMACATLARSETREFPCVEKKVRMLIEITVWLVSTCSKTVPYWLSDCCIFCSEWLNANIHKYICFFAMRFLLITDDIVRYVICSTSLPLLYHYQSAQEEALRRLSNLHALAMHTNSQLRIWWCGEVPLTECCICAALSFRSSDGSSSSSSKVATTEQVHMHINIVPCSPLCSVLNDKSIGKIT